MKKATIILLSLLILSTCAIYADGIHFNNGKTYKQLLTQAKLQHKLIFLDGFATWCGPCKYLQQNVFTQANVGQFFNANFINATFDMEKGEGLTLAEKFDVTAYPTLFFINGDGKLVHKAVGALEATELIALGRDALNPRKQYYTIKENAAAGKLSSAEFLAWVKTAEAMSDADLNAIVKNYLNKPGIDLTQKDVLEIMFYHAETLTDAQLKFLKMHREEVIKAELITAKDFNNSYTTRAAKFALETTFKDGVIDFEQFKAILTNYLPADAAQLQTQELKVKYYAYKKDDARCLDELAHCFDTSAYHMPLDDLEALIQKNAETIVKAKRGDEFIALLKQFKPSPDDAGNEYYLDIAQFILYRQMDKKDETAQFMVRIISNKKVPENIKTALAKYEDN